jgi:signal transduction histidine kinase
MNERMGQLRGSLPGASRFQELPIRRKLMFALLLTATASLLFAGIGIVAADSFLFYGFLQRDLSTLSQIIADNSTGALSFDDEKSGERTLATLRAREHVVGACLYRPDGSVLARYARTTDSAACSQPHADEVVGSAMEQLEVTQPVMLRGQNIGTLTLVYDLDEIFQRVWLYGGLVLGMLVLASVFAVALSQKLRTLIAAPLLELANLVTSVTRTKNYGIRARLRSPDEVGTLVHAFNEMLAGIQFRDDELRHALTAERAAVQQVEGVNADLQKVNAELARSNQDLERFAFIASHDLQEPLRMITSYTQLLAKQYPPGSDGQHLVYTQRIVEGTKRMRRLLSDLLTYAEVSAAPASSSAPVDMDATLEKVLENLRPAIEESGATVMSEKLPWLVADERHVMSLLQNLIGNSLKYRSAEPPQIHVSARSQDGGEVVFGVADNGIGIEPQYQQTIFAAFKRLHGKEIPGTGIGLTICQRIDRYNGKIWVEPREGAGVVFYFTLAAAGITWPEERR